MRKKFQNILSTTQQIGNNELNLEILINFFGAELIVKWHQTKKDIQQMRDFVIGEKRNVGRGCIKFAKKETFLFEKKRFIWEKETFLF